MPRNTRKKLVILNKVVTVDIGCGSCRKPKLFHIFFHPTPKLATCTSQKQTYNRHFPSSSPSSSSYDNNKPYKNNNNLKTVDTADYAPFLSNATPPTTRNVEGFGRIGNESVAVEKDSGDPYLDFRHSMLQMILENEIYSKDDLKELLNCFLQLNSPCNHGIIIRAFTEIWNAVFSVRSSSSSTMLHHFPRSSTRSRDCY